jgi:hypothetical protein
LFLGCLFLHSKCQKTFAALGNNRPQTLVRLEDFVLRAIIAISEGESRFAVLDSLYSQVSSLEKELANDEEALDWFNLSTDDSSTPPPSEFPSTPFAG